MPEIPALDYSQILISVGELNLRYGHFMATLLSLGIGDGTAVLK